MSANREETGFWVVQHCTWAGPKTGTTSSGTDGHVAESP